jgi:hypothetical protein
VTGISSVGTTGGFGGEGGAGGEGCAATLNVQEYAEDRFFRSFTRTVIV